MVNSSLVIEHGLFDDLINLLKFDDAYNYGIIKYSHEFSADVYSINA